MLAPNTKIELQKDQYRIIKVIGFGAYGVVWQAERISDGVMVAIKTIQTRSPENRSPYSKSFLDQIIYVQNKEIEFLRLMTPDEARQHHILPILDFGQFDAAPVMVLDLCSHSLAEVFVQRTDVSFPFDGATLVRWIGQIAKALKKVHTLPGKPGEPGRFSHRDLKLQNVLVKDNNLYLSDYGTVKRIGQKLTFSLAGTPDWGAPEMLLPKKLDKGEPIYQFNESADLYPLGLLIHALVTGNYTRGQGKVVDLLSMSGKPLAGAEKNFGQIGGLTAQEQKNLKNDIRRLFNKEGQTPIAKPAHSLPDWERIVAQLCDFVENLLAAQAAQRPTAEQVYQRANRMSELLNPALDALNIDVPHKVKLGRPYLLRISAKGRGLPSDGRWLNITVAGKVAEPRTIKKIADHSWKVKLPPLSKAGDYNVKAYAWVNNRKIDAVEDRTIRLSASAGKKSSIFHRLLFVLLIIGLLGVDAGIFYFISAKINNENAVLQKENQANKAKIVQFQKTIKTIKAIESQTAALQQKIEAKDIGLVALFEQIEILRVQLAALDNDKNGTHPPADEQLIDALLEAADKYIKIRRLTKPIGTNAYENYQKVLKIDPDNEKALAGIKKIADIYETMAFKVFNKQKYDKADEYIKKGLDVAPEHKGLLALNQKIERKKNGELPTPTPAPVVSPTTKVSYQRRSSPITVSEDEFKAVFKLDEKFHPKQYVPITPNRFQKIKLGRVIKDNTTHLMWQKSGSSEYVSYKEVWQYIRKLNSDRFAGYNDWRLPTVDELTSLLTKEKQYGDMYIHLLFDKKQTYCWSSDRRTSSRAWYVDFTGGRVPLYNIDDHHVRAVRAGQ